MFVMVSYTDPMPLVGVFIRITSPILRGTLPLSWHLPPDSSGSRQPRERNAVAASRRRRQQRLVFLGRPSTHDSRAVCDVDRSASDPGWEPQTISPDCEIFVHTVTAVLRGQMLRLKDSGHHVNTDRQSYLQQHPVLEQQANNRDGVRTCRCTDMDNVTRGELSSSLGKTWRRPSVEGSEKGAESEALVFEEGHAVETSTSYTLSRPALVCVSTRSHIGSCGRPW
ncbi:unnamed protein product [Boreogadus saida]